MEDSFEKREIERWRKTASRLAMALAVMILASGVIGSWMSSETRALDSYKRSNKQLRTSNKNVTEKLASSIKELTTCEEKNEELEEKILNLQLENASLKAMLDEANE